MLCLALPGCAFSPPGALTPSEEDARLVQGPPVRNIATPFDPALECLNGRIGKDIAFSVGNVTDSTGKEQYSDGGSGKFVTQGAGDMIQSALFRAGLTVVNRRDPNIPLAESNWGIRNIKVQTASDFYITGSINSLDFIPGGGAEISIAGVGPRYRQSRILIGVDLSMTSAHSGEIVANSSMQKQIYAEEFGISANRFFDKTLTNIEIGGMEREALHNALRQVLSYATFDLLAQILDGSNVQPCAQKVGVEGVILAGSNAPYRHGDGSVLREARAAAAEAAKAAQAAPSGQGGPAPAGQAQRPGAPVQVPAEARRLGNAATSYAAKAIAVADSVLTAQTAEEASKAADEALRYMTLAIQALRAAAAKGLTGPEGDAAATLVEKAIASAQGAQKLATEKAASAPEAPAPAPQAAPVAPPEETPPIREEDKRLGGPGR